MMLVVGGGRGEGRGKDVPSHLENEDKKKVQRYRS